MPERRVCSPLHFILTVCMCVCCVYGWGCLRVSESTVDFKNYAESYILNKPKGLIAKATENLHKPKLLSDLTYNMPTCLAGVLHGKYILDFVKHMIKE